MIRKEETSESHKTLHANATRWKLVWRIILLDEEPHHHIRTIHWTTRTVVEVDVSSQGYNLRWQSYKNRSFPSLTILKEQKFYAKSCL